MTQAECAHCHAMFSLQDPITFETRGVLLVGNVGCCSETCALQWAAGEVARLRGWLRRIHVRSHGVAGRLAKKALTTTLTITDDV